MALDQISKLYQDVLGREADTGGLDYWTNQLNSGTPLESIRNAFMGSQEYQQKQQQPQEEPKVADVGYVPLTAGPQTAVEAPKVADVGYVPLTAGPQTAVEAPKVADVGYVPLTAGPKSTDVVSGFYNQYLGREADQGGLDYWSNLLSSGQATPQQVQDAISGSSEAQARSSIQNAFKTSLGREADQAGLDYWTQQVASGALTPEAAAQQIAGSAEGIKYNAPKLVEADYQQYLGRPADEAGAAYWTEQLQSGAMTPQQVADAIKATSEGTDYGAMSTAIGGLYKTYLGRDIDQEGLQYWADKINKGEMSWDKLAQNIADSEEANTYRQANPVSYFGDIYARDEQGNLIPNQGSDEYGNPVAADGYQRGNYGFDMGMRSGESWDQYQTRITNYYGGAVGKMYEGILGRAVTADELNNIAKQYGGWTSIDLAQVQKDLALSPEALANAAKNGTWLTLTKDQTRTVNVPGYNYSYEVTEPVTKPVYIPPSVAGLPEAMREIYKSDNPQALIDQIKNDPAGWMKNQLANYAYTVGVNQRVASDHRYEAAGRWSYAYGDEGNYDKNAQMQKVAGLANDTAKWLLDNKAISQQEIADLWKAKTEQGGNDIQHSLDTIHEGGGGFWGSIANFGDQFGDFLEKYQVPIMTSILGGAVLGPAVGAAVGAAPGSATAIAVNAATTGLTQTAVALASGSPTNKALLAGGLAAAGVGLGGALGPSGLDVAGTLVAEGMNPILANVTVGALSGGALGALSGAASGDVGAGALGGALAGGITSGTSAATKAFAGMTGTLARFAAGTAVGMLTGKDISAALQGAAVGTVVGLAGSATKNAINAANSGKTDISTDTKFTPTDADVAALRSEMVNRLAGQIGEDQIESIREYVDSLPTDTFKTALTAVDGEVVKAVADAALYPQEAVKALYKQDLGRAPEPEGLKYWADKLRNGEMNLDQINDAIKSTSEGQKYASLDTGTKTDATSGVTTTAPVDVEVKVDKDGNLIEDKTTGGTYSDMTATPEFYKNAIAKLEGILASGINPSTGGALSPETISNTKAMLADFQSKYTGETIQSATPEELQQPSFWQEIVDKGASLFTFGTPGGGGVAVTGSGASGNLEGSKFSMFAFDGDQQKQQTIVYLENAVNNPELTPEQKAVAEKTLEEAKKTPVTTGGKPGSTETDTKKPGGDSGGGGPTTSPTPSGTPGADSAGAAAEFMATYNQVISGKVTSNQVKDMLNPMSPSALATSSIVPGSLSISKIQDDVNVMFNTFLGRSAEKAGLDYWSNKVKNGEMTLAQVATAIANSEEAKAKTGTTGTGTGATGTGTGTTGTSTSPTGTGATGTGTGTAGTGTSTGTSGTGAGTGGGTGGGSGTGTGTGTGAGEGTGSGGDTGVSTGTGGGGTGTGTGTGTGGGTGGGGTGGGTGGGGGGGGGMPYIPSLTQGTSGLNAKFPNLTADVVGGGATIDLGGEFGAPVISSMSYTPIGGLTFASGGSVDPLDTSEEISADTSDQSSGADVITGGTTAIDLGGEFAKTPSTYNVSTGTKNYAGGGIIGEDAGGMLFEGGWPAMQLARMRANRFKQLANVPQVSGTTFAQGGHVPEFYSEGGLNNRYVTGNGDGTSDDVPAMLANGEFVIPADVVSALGNGSNDSGASVLDEFLQVIRAHKQNHDPKQLPPDSLGPLAYLNKATKKAGK